MRDVELYARLKDLRMPPDQAWDLTARIRDQLHPVAAVAAAKIHKSLGTRGGLGASESAGSKAITVTALSSGGAIAAGAAYGSVVPGIGTAVGALVGLAASSLIHTSQAPQRAAMSASMVNILNQIPSAFVGRTIPWNVGSGPVGGLNQMLTAVMTLGIWFGWNSGLSRPSIVGNWVTVWTTIVKQIVDAIINNPVGATVSLNLTNHPGGNDSQVTPFTFVNPGLGVGPDVIANTIMRDAVAHQMVQGGRADQEQNMVTVGWPTVAKVFALMFDHAAADAVPNSLSTTLANAPIVNVPPAIAQAAAPIVATVLQGNQIPALTTGSGELAPVVTPTNLNTVYEANPTTGVPNLQPVNVTLAPPLALTPQQDTTAGLMQNMIGAGGANFVSPPATQLLADVAANGVEATPQGPPIMGSVPLWAVGLGALALVVLLRK
jgi:hypothetical protein